MKQVKTMLAAIGTLAVAGGTLAFNATKVGSSRYCVTQNLGSNICNTPVADASFIGGAQLKYVLTFNLPSCVLGVPCTETGVLVQ